MISNFSPSNLVIKLIRKLYDFSPRIIGYDIKSVKVDTIKNILPNVNLTIYKPIGNAKKGMPIMVYYHGGGWMLGSSKAYERVSKFIAINAKCIVMSVDYRLAPEYKFPAAYDDALNTYKWIVENAKKFGGDSKYITIAGDSAGGNLAMNVVNYRAKLGQKLPYAQVLIYPVIKANKNELEKIKNNENLMIKHIGFRIFNFFLKNYFGINKYFKGEISIAKTLPDALKDFPKTLIVTAALDPLTPLIEKSILEYRKKGLEVKHLHYSYTIHGFMNFSRFSKSAKAVLNDICDFIK